MKSTYDSSLDILNIFFKHNRWLPVVTVDLKLHPISHYFSDEFNDSLLFFPNKPNKLSLTELSTLCGSVNILINENTIDLLEQFCWPLASHGDAQVNFIYAHENYESQGYENNTSSYEIFFEYILTNLFFNPINQHRTPNFLICDTPKSLDTSQLYLYSYAYFRTEKSDSKLEVQFSDRKNSLLCRSIFSKLVSDVIIDIAIMPFMQKEHYIGMTMQGLPKNMLNEAKAANPRIAEAQSRAILSSLVLPDIDTAQAYLEQFEQKVLPYVEGFSHAGILKRCYAEVKEEFVDYAASKRASHKATFDDILALNSLKVGEVYGVVEIDTHSTHDESSYLEYLAHNIATTMLYKPMK